MHNSLIITRMPAYEHISADIDYEKKDSLMMVHFEDGRAKTISCIPQEDVLVSSIFVARVDSIAPQIHAIFVKISSDTICYLPDSEVKDAIFTHKPSKKAIAIGDELLVQINRLPIKTKFACVTTRLTMTGNYMVVTSKSPAKIGISQKINKQKQSELRGFFQEHWTDYHNLDMVARTNCKAVDVSLIDAEAQQLSDQMHTLMNTSKTKTLYSRVYQPASAPLTYFENSYEGEIDEIITDLPSIYEEFRTYFQKHPEKSATSLRKYADDYSLEKLYSLGKELKHALSEKVWLKSGAYLVIEQTEALTVIDVNSGKKETGKKASYFLDINMEAAEEIARQLILRNISGIIIIDFIDLNKEEDTEALLSYMRKLAKKDHVTTTIVDITRLHLMEVTRKKTGPTLFQQIIQDIT